MRIKTLIILAFYLAATTLLQAQSALQGRISSPQGDPVPYVTVGIISLSKPIGTTTDEKGRYRIQLPYDTTLIVRYSCTGYAPQTYTVKLSKNETKQVNLTLQPTSKQLDEIEIRDKKIDLTTFDPIAIEKLSDAVGPQTGVEALLKTLPDVNSSNELSSQYSVRGGSFDENLVYVNDIEIYRPLLVRSGQQEGLSLINPDLVSNILFSPGGFDASFGDKMSSVLDIRYNPPIEFKSKASIGFLGGSLYMASPIGKSQTLSVGFRQHSNRYLLKSLDTEGDYTTNYTDLQLLYTFQVSSKLSLSLLGIYTRNKYGLVPHNRTTKYGWFTETFEFQVYYDGQEQDRYNTLVGALLADYQPNEDWHIKWITSAMANKETESYDIQGQYWIYELNVGEIVGDVERVDRGVGTYLEHARNHFNSNNFTTEVKARKEARMGQWNMGLKYQFDQLQGSMREWKRVDSAGYSQPVNYPDPNFPITEPMAPMLQNVYQASNRMDLHRISSYLQRTLELYSDKGHLYSLNMGLRLSFWDLNPSESTLENPKNISLETNTLRRNLLWSPRMTFSFKPNIKKDMIFRLTEGVYHQTPYYREFLRRDGTMNLNLEAQHSYQTVGSWDWYFNWGESKFKLTTDVYYKYITNLIPYRIDNLRIQYDAHNEAVGYSTGMSVRVTGEFVEGLESWVSLSLMQTKQDILRDEYGWVARPTDQLFTAKVFFQDYMPTIQWWRMSLNFIYGTGLPFTSPKDEEYSKVYRLKPYFRVDWANTLQLDNMEFVKNNAFFSRFDEILLSLEVFNLMNFKNEVNYMWIQDINGMYHAIPNFLTARQINLKLTFSF